MAHQLGQAPAAGHERHGLVVLDARMMSNQDMDSLTNTTGAKFDRMFLTMMIKHHRGAIEMAKTEQTGGSNPAAIALAKQIETAQTGEITDHAGAARLIPVMSAIVSHVLQQRPMAIPRAHASPAASARRLRPNAATHLTNRGA